MYGTIARMRVKPGMEDRLRSMSQEEANLNIPGFIGQYVYRMDHDPNEYYMVVLFRDRETYVVNAHDPEQDARYRQMLQFLDGEPEWHDGEIVDSFIHSTTGMPGMTM